MDSTENTIRKALEEISSRASFEKWESDRFWTAAVKDALVDIGNQLGFRTTGSGCNSTEGCEWLFDIMWYQVDDMKNTTDIYLVAESEWGNTSEVYSDFEKLLVARSKYRVMVFQSTDETSANELINEMKNMTEKVKSTMENDRYLLACWNKDHWIFDVFSYANDKNRS
jgi:hypothetical protein